MPYTQTWFLGVANLRGGLYGVVDLAGFVVRARARRCAPMPARAESRLVALNAALEVNCALLIDRLAGLRSLDAFTSSSEPPEGSPAYFGSGYTDAGGALLAGNQPAGALAATPVPEHQRLKHPRKA